MDATKKDLYAYLERIGYDTTAADALIAREPNADDLQALLTAHLYHVPFENLAQLTHPAKDGCPAVGKDDPSLDVEKTLKKLVYEKRGGFCWEINFGFQFLLRSLGYKVRVANSNVLAGPPGAQMAIPGHLCLFVDGLGPDALLVDPGFGDAPRALVPVRVGGEATDSTYGDKYKLEANDTTLFGQGGKTRFDLMLTRSRLKGISGSPMVDFIGMDTPPAAPEATPFEPVYLLNSTDDLPLDAAEFQEGLASVLVENEMNPFSQKRMCIMMTAKGFHFIGKDYKKTIENGVEVSRTQLASEREYRDALKAIAGITLGA